MKLYFDKKDWKFKSKNKSIIYQTIFLIHEKRILHYELKNLPIGEFINYIKVIPREFRYSKKTMYELQFKGSSKCKKYTEKQLKILLKALPLYIVETFWASLLEENIVKYPRVL